MFGWSDQHNAPGPKNRESKRNAALSARINQRGKALPTNFTGSSSVQACQVQLSLCFRAASISIFYCSSSLWVFSLVSSPTAACCFAYFVFNQEYYSQLHASGGRTICHSRETREKQLLHPGFEEGLPSYEAFMLCG